MGTKKPSYTLTDTLSKANSGDPKQQPGGKISQNPTSRSKMTASSEQDRDIKREENWRREMECERMRDNARYKEIQTLDRPYERDRGLAPRFKEGEREWRERERRQEDDRGQNWKPPSNIEKQTDREMIGGKRKGDTFPRIRKGTTDYAAEMVAEGGERRQRDLPRGKEMDAWQREKHRYRDSERDEVWSRAKDPRERYADDERSQQKDRYKVSGVDFQDRTREMVDSRGMREGNGTRKMEMPRPDMGERKARMYSPYRTADREIYTKKRGQKSEGRRDVRSEGDSDERGQKRERKRDTEKEAFMHQLSRSVEDNRGETGWERDRDRPRYRERDSRSVEDNRGIMEWERDRDRQRHRERDRERETDRPWIREREGRKERYREDDRRAAKQADREGERRREIRRQEDDQHREKRVDRERKEMREDRTGRGSRSQSGSAPRAPPRAQSSGEWSSDMDSEARYRDSYEERDRRREGNHEHKRGKERQRDLERSEKQQIQIEKRENDREEMTRNQDRGKWLEPQRGKNSQDKYLDRERHTRQKEQSSEEDRNTDSQAEWGRDGRRIEEEPDEWYLDKSSYKEKREGRIEHRRDPEGVSVDADEEDEIWRETNTKGKEHLSDSDGGIEGSRQRDAEGDNTEESDREEEGGSDNWVRSEGEEGSEAGWKQDKERMLSGEDGFVTLSSGDDEEDERENDEKEFNDCHEFMEVAVTCKDPAPGFKKCEGDKGKDEEWQMGKETSVDEEDQGKGKKPKYVFCVIGQTFSRSETSEMSPSQDDQRGGAERERPNLGTHNDGSDDITQKWQDDHHPTSDRYDDKAVINNQDTKEDNYTSAKEKPASGDTAEGNERYRASSKLQDTEFEEGMKGKVKPSYAEFRTIKRDSQTEKLLKKWRDQNKELAGKEWDQTSDACSPDKLEHIHTFLDQIGTEAMSPEELEAIRIRMSGAWSTSEEPKRRSQAPHLKWAKTVVREILGHSDEQAVDVPNADEQENQRITQSESNKKPEVATERTMDLPVVTLSKYEESEPELEDEDQLEEFRGMGQSQVSMHADQVKAMHVTSPTYTHADIQINTGGKEDNTMDQNADPSGQTQLEKSDMRKLTEREIEAEVFLNVTNTLYKPNSCPILNYDSESELFSPSSEGKSQEVKDELSQSEDERQGEETEGRGTSGEIGKIEIGANVDIKEGEVTTEKEKVTLRSSFSFRDLSPQARFRRRGIRKTTERRNGELVGVQEEEGVGRDRRPIISSTTEDEDFPMRSWGEAELRNGMSMGNRKRNSRFFPDTQLYQQYSEAAQNFEILRQSRSDVLSLCEESTQSPAPSPPPARRPLPPLPAVPHPHSLSHTGSITSIRSLPVPEPPKNERRPSSPRLSFSLSQSSSLWRELPAVTSSMELEKLGEDKRRLQEVRFEVVTSEASYCRSLDIVVEHFVKSKALGALLGTQDKNWLFSRLIDVRAISRSFLSKLEERVESDVMNFTVCDIIARHCHRFRTVYVPYLTNQSYQDGTYQRLMNENPGFKRIVEHLEKSPVCHRLPLRSFLVLPFQRITRIKLLVQNIVKRTTPDTAEWTQAIKALKHLEKLIQESNDSISQMKSIESLVTLSAKVEFECRTLPLISQFRRLVREGPVTELMDFSQKETERKVYLHLFNDNLLLSLPKEGGRFTVIDHCPVSELRAENCRVKLLSLQKNLFRLHMSNQSLLLRAETQGDKLRWISALSRPHPKIDFSAAQEFEQMQCIRAFVGQQPDELSLEKADVILVHPDSAKCDDWVEGTKLSDRHRGWVPRSHLEIITNARVKQHNLSDALKLTTATAAV